MKKFLLLTLLGWHTGWCQTFTATASLPKVEQDGFCRIPLSPELVSRLNESFSNLRLYDSTQEIPYLLKTEAPIFTSRKFIEYPVIEKNSKGFFTQMIFGNPEKKSINNITLVIKNAETTKKATLLGSDDGATWYALKENFFLSSIQAINQTHEMRIVDFPLSNYAKFKLKINDSTSAPLNILKVGYYEMDKVSGNYSTLPSSRLTVDDNRISKKSEVKILFDTLMLVDKLEFTIKGPVFYNRSASIKRPIVYFTRKGKKVNSDETIQAVQFISSQQTVFHLPSVASKEIDFEINNDDNPPLQVTSVKAYQLNRYLIAWLVKGKVYTLKIGSNDMNSPSYDIGYFKDTIPSDPPTLNHTSLTVAQAKVKTKASRWFEDKRIIWGGIVLVIAILALMSFKMVNEAGKS